MIFTSFDFLLFMGPMLLGYWLLRRRNRLRLVWLLLSSYFFYAASAQGLGEQQPPAPGYVALLVGSTVLDFLCGRGMANLGDHVGARQSPRRRRRMKRGLLATSLAGNFGLLFYFKYAGFVLSASTDIATALGLDWLAPRLEVVLPIGISFYTFQSVSYTVDVYRGRIEAERSFVAFAAYIACFPQLVAGPIVRATELLPQLPCPPSLSRAVTRGALVRIWKGLVKKVVLGDLMGVHFVDPVFAQPENYSSLEVLVALYAFTLQIYGDFSGYSDMAIGVAALLGLRLPENFDRPHRALNVAEFWRRWHMTLSTWLRDYVYFPLGGSRAGRFRSYQNLWLTMVLVGLWHGASWTFVVYANLQALAMILNRWHRRRTPLPEDCSGPWAGHGPRWARLLSSALLLGLLAWLATGFLEGLDPKTRSLAVLAVVGLHVGATVLPERGLWGASACHILLTFHFTVLSRVFFRAEDLASVKAIAYKLLSWDGLGARDAWFALQPLIRAGADPQGLFSHAGLWLLVTGLAYQFSPAHWTTRAIQRLAGLPAFTLGLLLALTAAVCAQLLDGPRPNIYFNF